jgi:hypothetical protein
MFAQNLVPDIEWQAEIAKGLLGTGSTFAEVFEDTAMLCWVVICYYWHVWLCICWRTRFVVDEMRVACEAFCPKQ